MGSTCSY